MEIVFSELKLLFEDLKKTTQDKKNNETESGDVSKEVVTNKFDNIITNVEENLSKHEKGSKEFIKLLSMKASLMYEKAKTGIVGENLDNSKELLENTLKLISDYTNDSQIIFLHLRVLNHLSYILSRSGDFEQAKLLLEGVNEVSLNDKDIDVYSTEDLFTDNKLDAEQSKVKLNKLLINNMQMLGWIYGKMEMYESHTAMQHKCLQKYLDISDSDVLNWIGRCSRLATLFLTHCQYVNARYHLAAAEEMLNRCEQTISTNPEINRIAADLARSWIHYGLHLFSTSKKTILDRMYVKDEPLIPNVVEEELPESFKFIGLTFTIPEVPAVQVFTTSHARILFIYTQKWLKRARLYYTLRDYPLQYVNAVLDLSELYRFLAFYEPDLDSQYNVQKKRADALETLCTILKEVRPSCYLAVSVELLRELAEVQIELMGLNLKRLCQAEGAVLNEDNLRQRVSAVQDIRTKLANVGDMMGNAKYDKDECLNESISDGQSEDVDEDNAKETIEADDEKIIT